MKPQRTGFAAMAVVGALALSIPVRAAAQNEQPFAADSLHLPRVRYVPLANLDGFRLPTGEPWSPASSQLLLVNRGALYIVDATDSTFTPRLLLESQVLDVRWSPDGSYVACRIRVPTAIRGGSVRLQFVEAAGGPSETRTPRGRIGTTVWANDGALYFWDSRTGIRKRLQAPLSWRNRHPSLPPERHVHLLQLPRSGKRRPRVIAFTPTPQPNEHIVTALMPPQATQVSIVDDIPGMTSTDEARFLVQMQPRRGSLRTYVVDAKGAPLARLGDTEGLPAFIGTSVSADGQVVIGHRARGGAGMLLNSEVWVADTAGKWSTPVENAPSSVAARFSNRDLILAHEDPNGETVRLGRLEIEMP